MGIKLYNCDIRNFGDNLAGILVRTMLEDANRKDLQYKPMHEANLLAIGSVLFDGSPIVSERCGIMSRAGIVNRLRWLNCCRFPVLHLWGTGFLDVPRFSDVIHCRRLKVHAVRGAQTLKILRAWKFVDDDAVVLGDPGLLYRRLLTSMPEKRYDIGIVPHYLDSEIGKYIHHRFVIKGVKSLLVDVESENPLDVLKSIAACDVVLSSSLHGCIVADSLNIPNEHMYLSNLGRGDSFLFKFSDYYSALHELPREMLYLNDILDSPIKCIQRVRCSRKVDAAILEEIEDVLIDKFKRIISML